MKLSDDFEILLFKLQNGQKYGIDILKIKEIINFSKINKIPNSKKNIEGFISLRDETVAVINTDKSISVINDNYKLDDNKFIIIIHSDNNLIGLIVKDVELIFKTNKNNFSTPKNIGTKHYLNNFLKHDNKIIQILNTDKIINEM